MDRARTLAVVSVAKLGSGRWHGGRAAAGASLRRLLDARTTRGDRPRHPVQRDRPARSGVHAPHPGSADPVMARRPSRRAALGLRIVGLTMVAGYLGERLVRQRLRPAGWDTIESPLIIAALGLSVAMAALGNVRPASAQPTTAPSPSPVTAACSRLLPRPPMRRPPPSPTTTPTRHRHDECWFKHPSPCSCSGGCRRLDSHSGMGRDVGDEPD